MAFPTDLICRAEANIAFAIEKLGFQIPELLVALV